MAAFEVTEIQLEPLDVEPTLEDEFTMTAVMKEMESIKDPEVLRAGALNLLRVAMHRQAVIRGLCKRLAQIETANISTTKFKG